MNPEQAKSPGQLIKALLDARGWSQRVLAVVLGVDEAVVNRYVANKKSIDAGTACLAPRADFGKNRMTIEHIEPLVSGGVDTWRNIVGAHEGCNHQRSNRPLLHYLLFRQLSSGRTKVERRHLRRTFFRSLNASGNGR